MGLKLGNLAKGLATGGLYAVYKKNKRGIQDFFGKSDRRNARAQAAKADEMRERSQELQLQALDISNERRKAEGEYLQSERDRYDKVYAPIEQQMGLQLRAGPRTEEQAMIAGDTFANEFDAATASREREQRRLGINYGAGSSALRMQGENDAYNRAMGIATSRNTARREEDDRHFLRSSQFFTQNGSGIRGRLLQGMNQMYGADYDSKNNAALSAIGQGQYHQNTADQYTKNSMAGVNTLMNVGARVASAYMTGGKSEAGELTKTGGVDATVKTPQTNQLLGSSQPGQARSAMSGSRRSEINQY